MLLPINSTKITLDRLYYALLLKSNELQDKLIIPHNNVYFNILYIHSVPL